MAYKTVTLPFVDKADVAISFPAALAVARMAGGFIEGIVVRQRPILPAGAFHPYAAPYIDSQFAEIEAAENEMVGSVRADFEKACSDNGVSLSPSGEGPYPAGRFSDLEGHMPEICAAYARVSDLIVMANPAGQRSDSRIMLIQELIFQTGRPLLLVPEALKAVPTKVTLAWDGGRAACVAMNAALPFLEAASEVDIVSVGPLPIGNRPPAHAADVLQRHGISAKAHEIADEAGINDQEQFAKMMAATPDRLIVMGGYSHSRWRQMILGGFTKKMLTEQPGPVLMAH